MLLKEVTPSGRLVTKKIKPCDDCGVPLEWTFRAKDVCHPCRLARRKATYKPTGSGKQAGCPDCGASVEATFSKGRFYTKRCDTCAFTALRKKQRKSMANVRLRAGVAPVKGTEIACAGCGVICQRNGVNRRYCDDCGAQIWRVSKHKALNLRMGNHIRAGITSGSKRRRKWEALVGYTCADLMRHLERQFLPGMSWDNRCEWHIDHIRPLCSFEFQTPDCSQFGEAWALTNLRPIWARDNLKKSGSRTLLL